MPKILEEKLEKEYRSLGKKAKNHAVYGTMNKIGAMHGDKETKKGKKIEEKLEARKKAKKEEEE